MEKARGISFRQFLAFWSNSNVSLTFNILAAVEDVHVVFLGLKMIIPSIHS